MALTFVMKSSYSQVSSASDNLKAQPISDRSIVFNVEATGIAKPITWGLDLAWLSERNIIRGMAFMEANNVDVIRSSFMPTQPLLNDETLQGDALTNTNLRIDIIKNNLGAGTNVVLNSDHPSVNDYFKGNAANWAKLIEVTAQMHEAEGFNIVTVSPFNEPDFTNTGQGTMQDFYNICGQLKSNSYFDNIRVSGGNTLNTDEALNWYNYLKTRLDEGNTHQLAGSFDNYANFFQTVSSDGNHATNDELHNVMEAMVGVEYGLQTGIWWGTAELARGEFVKASDGVRLGYAEHRPNWTSASVYRHTNGKVQAFGGTSERQARPTNYTFLSKDRVVYYDGVGPQREYVMELPADPNGAYQTALQRNAERVVNISWGEDVQPEINGEYKIVNKNSGLVMEVSGSGDGANVRQNNYVGSSSQKFTVVPVPIDIGGDFSYYRIKVLSDANRSLDVNNFSLDNGGNIHLWTQANGGNQQWYLDYQSDGWFLIRSRESSHCIDVYQAGTNAGANIVQWEKNGGANQEWRFLPVDAPIEFDAPSAPTNLEATVQPTSVRLDWDASPETDVAGYHIYRAEAENGAYNTIARTVTNTAFIDNTALSGINYFYKIKAIDGSLNRSEYSNVTSGTASGAQSLVAQFNFENNTQDASTNLNHAATAGTISFETSENESQAITLNGSDAFVQLPPDIASHQELTMATWVNWNGGGAWQRIFDFGNNTNEYLFLTPSSGAGTLRFGMKIGSGEQFIESSVLPTGEWTHVAVTISTSGVVLYVNGQQVAQSTSAFGSPLNIKPALNYIGRSQFPDPLLNGSVDDFRVYNYALSPAQVEALAAGTLSVNTTKLEDAIGVYPVPSDDALHVKINKSNLKLNTVNIKITDIRGVKLQETKITNSDHFVVNTAQMSSGIYVLEIENKGVSVKKKFVVKH
ncbi:hypothetical protein PK35_02610 [Tamlana nanhaiensis]|uniref:Fibronectin type-III domain-containing protein n=2 Tax=Neotamlana nanhaiensis TaxID=1382798 RepID=A0A0D7W6T2_9FLAO|nr:hypothetical protein PK35_02610 [Tamlana nanhaiensis]